MPIFFFIFLSIILSFLFGCLTLRSLDSGDNCIDINDQYNFGFNISIKCVYLLDILVILLYIFILKIAHYSLYQYWINCSKKNAYEYINHYNNLSNYSCISLTLYILDKSRSLKFIYPRSPSYNFDATFSNSCMLPSLSYLPSFFSTKSPMISSK